MDVSMALTVVLSGTVGAGWLISRAIREHEWRSCGCNSCGERRDRAWQKQRARVNEERLGRQSGIVHISTALLDPGMYVGLNGTRYYVRNVRTDSTSYLVDLTNLITKQKLVLRVPLDKSDHKYWEPMRRRNT